MKDHISITSMASVSALGSNPHDVWTQYLTNQHRFKNKTFNGFDALVSSLSEADWNAVSILVSLN
ncbi:hypothetical protein N8480_02335 [Flavobacteriaceae bacterium]|nr:hypothetical protein [Flavobacteriaceae bacterium]MDC1539491.1 hypothetical protein [Flavobacteriaceae bacterium]